MGIWSLHSPAPPGDYGKLSMQKTWMFWSDFQSLRPKSLLFLEFPAKGRAVLFRVQFVPEGLAFGKFQGAHEHGPLQGACVQWSSGSSRLSWGCATIETTLELAVGVESPRKHKDWKKDQQFCLYPRFWVVHFVRFPRVLYNAEKMIFCHITLCYPFCNIVMNSCNWLSWGGLDALTQNNKNVLSKRFRL